MKFMNINRKFYEEANGDGGNGDGGNWRDSLPDDLKGNAALANFEDVGQMAKSFVDMKSYQGNSIHIPGEDAGDEDRRLLNVCAFQLLGGTFVTTPLDVETEHLVGPGEHGGGPFAHLRDVPSHADRLSTLPWKNDRCLAHQCCLLKPSQMPGLA